MDTNIDSDAKRKGFLPVAFLLPIILLVICAVIVFVLWTIFSSGSGRAASGAFYALVDPILSLF